MEDKVFQYILSTGGSGAGLLLLYMVWNMNKKVSKLCDLIPRVEVMKEEISDLRKRVFRLEDRGPSNN